MNPEEIKMMLTKVCSDLQYIQHSLAFQQVLDTSASDPEMETLADTAILFTKKLKHCFGTAVDKLDVMETELDEEMAALLGGGF